MIITNLIRNHNVNMDNKNQVQVEAFDDIDRQIMEDIQKEDAGNNSQEQQPPKKQSEDEGMTKNDDDTGAGNGEDDDTKEDDIPEDDDKSLAEKKPEAEQDFKKSGKYIPIGKHLEQKKEWSRRETELLKELEIAKAERSSDDSQKELDAKIQEYADEFGYDFETAKKQLSIFQTMLKPISEKLSTFDQMVEERNKQRELDLQIPEFNKEFDLTVLPLIKQDYPNATLDQIEKVKNAIKDKAFGEDLNQKLNYIFYGNVKDLNKILSSPKQNRQPEQGRSAGRQNDAGADIESMSEEEALTLSDEDFEKWGNFQASKSRSFTVYGPNGNKIN